MLISNAYLCPFVLGHPVVNIDIFAISRVL